MGRKKDSDIIINFLSGIIVLSFLFLKVIFMIISNVSKKTKSKKLKISKQSNYTEQSNYTDRSPKEKIKPTIEKRGSCYIIKRREGKSK